MAHLASPEDHHAHRRPAPITFGCAGSRIPWLFLQVFAQRMAQLVQKGICEKYEILYQSDTLQKSIAVSLTVLAHALLP